MTDLGSKQWKQHSLPNFKPTRKRSWATRYTLDFLIV